MAFSFTNIIAWQKAKNFTLLVYEITKQYPESERFNIVSQFQRAAVSVCANIAEGYKKLGKNDKLRFLNIAQGSLSECANYIILSHELNFIKEKDYDILCKHVEETTKVLNAYCSAIVQNSGIKD